jgi:outer membrane protein OmpA-like peptidoglycan-associated protein
VNADERAQDLWQKAERQLYEAASRGESGRTNAVPRYAEKAEELFRDAELEAIKTALFTEIEENIEAAKDLDADDWAPKSYQFARDLLSQARTELEANRYDTDRPRDLANQALHYARHAQYVARLADDIDDNDTTLENVLMDWEAAIGQLGTSLDLPLYFDNGPGQAIQDLNERILKRGERLKNADEDLAASRARATILEEEMSRLQADLEGQELAQNRLSQRLAEQEVLDRKFKAVEGMFTPDEAIVLRVKEQLVIRLIGLGFASGSARLEARHYPLLGKLQQALGGFPGAPVTIEGHTDSYGMDASNLQLSIDRAEAVKKYLLANTSMAPLQLSATGYGESRPIANNETAEGRLRNRRIDVVIYP